MLKSKLLKHKKHNKSSRKAKAQTKIIKTYSMKRFLQYVLMLALLIGTSTAVQAQGASNPVKISDTAGCSPLKVKFSSTYKGVIDYRWDFGNGNTSVLANPVNVYTVSGRYTIKLTVTYSNGDKDSVEMLDVVHVVGLPKPDFSLPYTQLCPNSTLQFTNKSQDAVRYIWDFGDGLSSADPNPVHTYAKPGVYTVKLLATNKYNCSEVKEVKNALVIQDVPKANFTVNQRSSCDPAVAFQFKYSGTPASKYLWSFGDGFTSTASTPSHNYKTPGTYDIQLVVYNSTGCTDTLLQKGYVTLEEPLQPNFGAEGNNACIGSLVRFKDSTKGAAKWFWNFGDGTTSVSKNPTHTYKKSGNYTVKLTVTSKLGCQESIEKEDLVQVSGGLYVGFVGQAAGCGPLSVSFSNTSANSERYVWEFGDGATSTERNPTHIYTKSGDFTVKLHGFGKNGCEKLSIIENAVVVFAKPAADFSVSDTNSCPPFKLRFRNTTKYGVTYHWDFGDGTTSTDSSPVHTYTAEGIYSITLVAANAGGCGDSFTRKDYIVVKAPDMKYSGSKEIKSCTPYTARLSDATPGNVAWNWDFGDGTTSTLQNPEHTWKDAGKYSVTLTTITESGCQVVIKDFQKYNLAPYTGSFTYTQSKCPPYQLTFKDSSSDGIKWIWSFGDGTASAEQNPTHTFDKSGDYEVRLTVINESGCNYTVSKTIHFDSYGADFTAKPLSETSPVVQFKANVSNYSSLEWDFGDGTTSTTTDPLHTYKKRDDHLMAKLTVVLKNNCTITTTKKVFEVIISGDGTTKKPNSDFSPSTNGGCAPLSLVFYNKSTSFVRCLWEFGDGTTSTDKSPAHIFITPGVYKVKLTVYNVYGVSSTYTYTVKATEVVPDMHIEQITKGDSVSFYFEDRTAGAELRLWDFGDGTTSIEESPTHKYEATDDVYYNVKLTIIDSFGCMGTTVKAVRNSLLTPFSISSRNGCVGVELSFNTKMKEFKAYDWHFGDGITASEMRPKHAYKEAKKYLPSLTVTDEDGNKFTYYSKDSIQINDVKALFTVVGPSKGCDSVTVMFNNESSQSDKWHWDFGDGTSSTQKNPVHTYTKEGKFSPVLTSYSHGCNDVYQIKDAVTVLKAHPNFAMKQLNGCFPITIQFEDKSKNAVNWEWDFGDGTSSDERNPVHTFYEMPAGKTSLRIINTDGCEGSTAKPSIVLLKSSFSVKSSKGCVPFAVNFGNNSIMAKTWYWDFGDGTTSTEKSPLHVYSEEGVYTVKLVANAEEGCTDTIIKHNLITAVLTKAGFSSPVTAICAPTVITFTDESHGAGKWFWDFGDGSTSDVKSPVHIYNHPGFYTIKQAVTNQTGCTDTLIKKDYIHILGPISKFTLSETSGCPPMKVNFIDKSINAASWQWNFGDGYTSNQKEPEHFYTTPGQYSVTLITFDSTGCKSVYVYPGKIKVKDTTPPENTTIKRVTVSSNTDVNIEWQMSDAANFAGYILWRQNNTTGKFEQVTTIDDKNVLSYTDMGLNTLQNTYTYKLQVQNECGHAAQLSECMPHTTINVTAVPMGVNIQVSWTPYKGSNVGTYTLYRQEPNTVPVAVATLTGDQLTFIDTTLYCPMFYAYRIEANSLNGTALFSLSDTSIAKPADRYKTQKVTVVRSTVLDNKSVLTEWQEPLVEPQRVSSYNIYRSENNENFTLIQNVPRGVTSFVDEAVNVQEKQYYYRIKAVNMCQVESEFDNHGVSILLNGSTDREDNTNLHWTSYDGWPTKPAYYIIERLNERGEWETIERVPGNVTEYKDTK
jgi:PKD repeat protein